MSLNKDNHNDSAQDKLIRLEALKRKLYSNSKSLGGAVQEEALHRHTNKVGHSWAETDAQVEAEEVEKKKREAEESKGVGIGFGSGVSGLYGHYSLAEDAEKNRRMAGIQTGLAGTGFVRNTYKEELKDKKEKPESIGAFLSDKFAAERAEITQKKIASDKVALVYAAAQAEAKGGTLYPNLKKPDAVPADAQTKPIENEERYHPDFKVFTVGQKRLEDMDFEVHHNTQNPTNEKDAITLARMRDEEKLAQVQQQEKRKRIGFGAMLFLCIVLFFIGALGYAYIHFQKGTNVISPEKINIAVTGPVSVRSGEVSDFYVDITNNNNTELIQSDLVVQFPEGTKDPVDTSKVLHNKRIDVGTVPPYGTVRQKVSAVFFGEENVKKNLQYSFEFNIAESASIFSKDKTVGVFITGSPITAQIINVKEITNNQELSFDVEITSNSDSIVKNIQLRVEYPFGFKLKEANLKPVADNNTWAIGDMEALGRKVIKIKGVLVGSANLEKNFRFILGVADEKTGNMATVLSTQDQKVSIQKPFVATTLTLNGNSNGPEAVVYGENIQGSIVFRNELKVPLTDAVVEMRINGVLVDRGSIKADGGFYRSGDDTLFWDKAQTQGLELISPGESREVTFNISVADRKDDLVKVLRRAGSSLTITIQAKRLNENRVPESITYGTSRDIRLGTDLGLASYLEHVSGPLPAKVNTETVYRYKGRITNTSNAVKNTVFFAKLPPNSVWKNAYSSNIPRTGVKYDTGKREIVLQFGEIPAGTGIDTSPIDFYFDIGFTPSLTQKNTVPPVILSPQITGTDTFIESTVQNGVDSLDTSGNSGGGPIVE